MSARRFAAGLQVLIAACVALLAFAALAQDPGASVVQGAARLWLAKADALDGENTWKGAGAKFRQAITVDRWTEALKGVRTPLGAVEQRTAASTTFTKELPGVPNSEYAIVQFRTAFAKKPEAGETVTLEREADGDWRVVGYFIR